MHKKILLLAFGTGGIELGERIRQALDTGEAEVAAYAPARLAPPDWEGFSTLKEEMGELFFRFDAIVFIGAVGIAVRLIAPFLRDKTRDPAVLAVDEGGTFVIPILSGHIGGANELARHLAGALSSVPVITTATDVHDLFSVDTYARQQHLAIVEKDEIKHLSAALLAGEPIGALTPESGFLITPDPVGQPFSHTLHLVPQDLVVGVGCRRGVDGEALYGFLSDTFQENGWSLYRIRALTSIDVKAGEPGLIDLARRLGVPFLTYPADELLAAQGEFSGSEFVRRQVGVDNVCERSALCGAVREGWLPPGSRLEDFVRLRKRTGPGMTLAVLALCKQAW
jgi:cobalamin biosynthesis protein CbiG